MQPTLSIGDHLREWRRRRRMSQLDLALEAEISQKHLSFVESGRSVPTREMVLRLSEQLDLPLRDRNLMLLAAGYAPAYPERALDDPALGPARDVIELILKGHEPFPALAIDRHWTLVAANAAVPPLLTGVADPALVQPPANVLRLSLHPNGLAPRIVNLPEWRNHLLDRLHRQITATGDPSLIRLLNELASLPSPSVQERSASYTYAGLAVPLRLATDKGVLSFISTTTVFGTPLDVALSELALETFFPADSFTKGLLYQSHASARSLGTAHCG
jgi:transcriptional regulator with XRE-family HTH domain